jgi:hypothetical protein
MVERKDPSRFVVVGGDEADACRAAESDFRIRSGTCPNGCGLLEPTDYGQRCPACGFFCNTRAGSVAEQ